MGPQIIIVWSTFLDWYIVKAWALLNKEDLEANWELAVNGEELFKIRPLQ